MQQKTEKSRFFCGIMTALAESIFNLVPETFEAYERSPVYKSKFVNASLTGSTFCKSEF